MNWDEEFGVNVRLLAVICGLALLGANLSGCAGNAKNVRTDEIAAEAMNLEAFPQIVLSNAPRAEAKSVAMGAARSKGWSSVVQRKIVSSCSASSMLMRLLILQQMPNSNPAQCLKSRLILWNRVAELRWRPKPN
ncbi:hypothetical protein CXB77_08415 [Chromatium okenii]|uniref:Uncharacterized protein n=1 Tax=Chromatium okenii TaxID=61644 RepID=A0A2S7XR03_9GAMM|nr:hypothetical protein CXB77_08415 [Chromatium okenii]